MSIPPRIAPLLAALLAGALLGGGGFAIAARNSPKTIHGCLVSASHQLLIQKRCQRGETKLTWNQQGPTGPIGRTGATGAVGPTGAAGAPGPQGAPGSPGQNAVSAWEVVNADGSLLAGTDLGVIHEATGDYQLDKATAGRHCAIQVTPDNNSNGVTVPPILASIANAPIVQQVYLTNTSGAGVDDGFSVSVQC